MLLASLYMFDIPSDDSRDANSEGSSQRIAKNLQQAGLAHLRCFIPQNMKNVRAIRLCRLIRDIRTHLVTGVSGVQYVG